MKLRKRLVEVVIYAFLILFVMVLVFPVFWALMTSLKHPVDAFAMPPKWFFTPTLKFHQFIWTERPFPKYLFNSLSIALGTVLISVPLAALAAYGYSRYKSKWTQRAMFSLLAVRMFPRMLLVIPFFVMAKHFGLYDTIFVMILISVAFNQPFATWLLKGFFDEVPIELDEAAVVDGCSKLQTFYRIILPAIRPGLVTTVIFSFLLAYNEYLFALVLTGTESKTLPVAIAEYGAEKIEYWLLSSAGAIGIIAPIVILMVILQRHFIKGLTMGALK